MGILATIAFLVLGWTLFDDLIREREDPNYNLSASSETGEWVLRRNRAGHYLAPGTINGHPVRFLLDTGATQTAIPATLGPQLGLAPGAAISILTANGRVTAHHTTVAELQLGPFLFRNSAAHLNPGMGGSDILLGMNVLRQLEFTQHGDLLVLRAPSAARLSR